MLNTIIFKLFSLKTSLSQSTNLESNSFKHIFFDLNYVDAKDDDCYDIVLEDGEDSQLFCYFD